MASHGAAVGLLIGLWLFSRKNKLPYIWSLDRIMLPVAIGGAIVRLGNLFNSEIVGAVTDVSWGFKFVRLYPNVPIDSIPVQHPTQLYEALCYLVIFGILCWLYYGRDLGRRRPGVMFGVGLIGIFLTRFFIEFIKLDQEAFEQGMLLNMGQLLSIPFILVGIYMIYRGMHRSPVDPDTVRVVRQQTVRQQGGSSKPRKHRPMKWCRTRETRVLSLRWPTDGKFGFRESARSFPNFGVPGVHRLGSWNVLPGALPFSSPSSGACP